MVRRKEENTLRFHSHHLQPTHSLTFRIIFKMGHATAEAVLRAGLTLVPYSFTGSSEAVAVGNVGVAGYPVELIGPERRAAAMAGVLAQFPGLVVVDYTLPSAVNDNARFYIASGVPFVMGTTGGDREALAADVRASGAWAVVAPQMGKQVVAFQATLETMASRFPGAFGGYALSVTESHQRSKVDTSGTAKAVVESFRRLGVKEFKDVRFFFFFFLKGKEMDGVRPSSFSIFRTHSLSLPLSFSPHTHAVRHRPRPGRPHPDGCHGRPRSRAGGPRLSHLPPDLARRERGL